MQITAMEAAKRFGVNPATIRAMCLERRVPGVHIPDNHHKKYGIWMVGTDDLEAYWKKQSEKFQCKPLAPTDSAYLAGLLDGEGCFTIFITRKQRHWTTIYYIQILMVEREPIEWLKEVTGLGYFFKRNRQKQGYQDLWGWRVTSGPACEVIEQIMPYLKAKRRHAEIFLELRERVLAVKNYRQGKRGNAGMPEEEYLARQRLIDEIHQLNKRTGKVQRRYSVRRTSDSN